MLDASITLSWCFEDQATGLSKAALERLRDDRGVVPELWPFEVGNVLLLAERRGRISQPQTVLFVQLLDRLPITVEELGREALQRGVMALARKAGLTLYDAAYLALAERVGAPLATGDKKLREAALAVGVELLTAP
ncbi:MAG: type II toxin-antitoxin system VapC family toxin [Candidatus Dormibacteria bacterium]